MYSVRGNIDDRISVLLASVGQSDSDNAEIAYPLIKEVDFKPSQVVSTAINFNLYFQYFFLFKITFACFTICSTLRP